MLFGQIFTVENGQILNKYSSQLVTLDSSGPPRAPQLRQNELSNLYLFAHRELVVVVVVVFAKLKLSFSVVRAIVCARRRSPHRSRTSARTTSKPPSNSCRRQKQHEISSISQITSWRLNFLLLLKNANTAVRPINTFCSEYSCSNTLSLSLARTVPLSDTFSCFSAQIFSKGRGEYNVDFGFDYTVASAATTTACVSPKVLLSMLCKETIEH